MPGSIMLLLVFMAGCSSLGRVHSPQIQPLKTRELPSGSGWWFARFRMQWPPDTQPVWYMDLYLAHQVILPKLERFKKDIHLWRFHRRAVRDGAGRQFSFIFHASPRTAGRIFNALQTDRLVGYLKAEGVLDRAVYDDPARMTRPLIEDTSDENWPASVQKTWPYYIMGASQMWLNLIAEIAGKNLTGDPPASMAEIKAFYQQVDQTVTRLWQQEGRHALMHHLNALVEYQPLIYRDQLYLTF
jgi:hypothetical protein